MAPVPTEDFELDPPNGSIWQALLNLAISVLVVCAAALIGSFLGTASTQTRTAAVSVMVSMAGARSSKNEERIVAPALSAHIESADANVVIGAVIPGA